MRSLFYRIFPSRVAPLTDPRREDLGTVEASIEKLLQSKSALPRIFADRDLDQLIKSQITSVRNPNQNTNRANRSLVNQRPMTSQTVLDTARDLQKIQFLNKKLGDAIKSNRELNKLGIDKTVALAMQDLLRLSLNDNFKEYRKIVLEIVKDVIILQNSTLRTKFNNNLNQSNINQIRRADYLISKKYTSDDQKKQMGSREEVYKLLETLTTRRAENINFRLDEQAIGLLNQAKEIRRNRNYIYSAVGKDNQHLGDIKAKIGEIVYKELSLLTRGQWLPTEITKVGGIGDSLIDKERAIDAQMSQVNTKPTFLQRIFRRTNRANRAENTQAEASNQVQQVDQLVADGFVKLDNISQDITNVFGRETGEAVQMLQDIFNNSSEFSAYCGGNKDIMKLPSYAKQLVGLAPMDDELRAINCEKDLARLNPYKGHIERAGDFINSSLISQEGHLVKEQIVADLQAKIDNIIRTDATGKGSRADAEGVRISFHSIKTMLGKPAVQRYFPQENQEIMRNLTQQLNQVAGNNFSSKETKQILQDIRDFCDNAPNDTVMARINQRRPILEQNQIAQDGNQPRNRLDEARAEAPRQGLGPGLG